MHGQCSTSPRAKNPAITCMFCHAVPRSPLHFSDHPTLVCRCCLLYLANTRSSCATENSQPVKMHIHQNESLSAEWRLFLYHPSIIIGIHNHPLYRQCHVGRTKTEVVQPILAASMRDVSSPCGTSAPPIRREHSVWPSPTPRALSRTLKVRGGMISQAHRYLGCFCSSQRIFLPQIIQVLLTLCE